MSGKITYQFMAPVCVEVENGIVTRVVVIDEAGVNDPAFVEGDREYFRNGVAASLNGQSWPAWEFAY